MSFFVAAPVEARPRGWFEALLSVVRTKDCASSCAEATYIIPGTDPLNAHWPRYAAVLSQRGGPEAYFDERQARIDQIWEWVVELLPTLAPTQRVLLFDLESSHVPSSASIHRRKHLLPAEVADRLVHVSIAASAAANYRPDVDISFPGVIPASLGDAEQARVPLDQRHIRLAKPAYTLCVGEIDLVLAIAQSYTVVPI